MAVIRFHTVWLRNLRVWRKNLLATLVGSLGQPLLFLLAMGHGLGQAVEPLAGLTYPQYIAPGLAVSAVMYTAAFETTYGSYTRLAIQKTYEAILMTPLSMTDLVLGEVAWGASKGLLAGMIVLLVLPFFGVIPSPWVVAALPVLLLVGICFAALGLIMTALATNYDFFNYFISLVITPLFLFSGIFFPLELLPGVAGMLLAMLPLAPVVTVARALCLGRLEATLPFLLVGPLLFSIIAVWMAVVLLRRRLIH
ncbi:MAG: ABC transporter permease [Thermodesulfobacteriota bacterium]